MKMDIKELLQELTEAIEEARKDAEEYYRLAHNSYGAGYARGELDALERVKHLFITGEWPEF